MLRFVKGGIIPQAVIFLDVREAYCLLVLVGGRGGRDEFFVLVNTKSNRQIDNAVLS